jgi:hypothetical protein
MKRALLLLASLALGACNPLPGGSPATGSRTAVSPAAPFPASASRTQPQLTARAAGPLVVVLTSSQPSYTLQLVTLDGRVAMTYALPPGYVPTGAGGDYVLLKSDAGQVTALSRDGHLYDLGTLASSSGAGPLVSPDGRLWIYSTDQWDQATGVIHSKAFLGPLGKPGQVVDSSDEQYRDLRPYSWTAVGPAVEHGAVGIGGYFIFYNATGPVDRVDADAMRASRLSYDPTACGFTDASADGRVACVVQGATTVLKVFTGGSARPIALTQPRFKVAGAAYFNPAIANQMVIGGSQAVGPPHELLETDLVDINTGTLKQVGPPNSRPFRWLGDGSLLLDVPDFSAGPNPGTYLLKPDGTFTRLSAGQPYGVLGG